MDRHDRKHDQGIAAPIVVCRCESPSWQAKWIPLTINEPHPLPPSRCWPRQPLYPQGGRIAGRTSLWNVSTAGVKGDCHENGCSEEALIQGCVVGTLRNGKHCAERWKSSMNWGRNMKKTSRTILSGTIVGECWHCGVIDTNQIRVSFLW